MFRPFQRSDNLEYSKWFKNEAMDKWLGLAWSSEELSTVLMEQADILAFTEKDDLAGVACLDTSLIHRKFLGLNSIAVRPDLQRKGLGTKFLGEIVNHYKNKADKIICFVELGNKASQSFLSKNKWREIGKSQGMIQYEYNIT